MFAEKMFGSLLLPPCDWGLPAAPRLYLQCTLHSYLPQLSEDIAMAPDIATVSCIVVTYNSASEIDSCLRAIATAVPSIVAEVIVVDNASADDTRERVGRYPFARLAANRRNYGFAAAVNQGVSMAGGDFCLVLNPDVMVTSEALRACVDALMDNKDYAAAGCGMVYSDGTPQASCRPFPTVLEFARRALTTNSLAARVVKPHTPVYAEPAANTRTSSIRPVDWILGAYMMIRRSAYDDIGPFDEKYFLYYEDTDWCYRAHRCGWEIGFISQPRIVHRYHRSSGQLALTNSLTWIHLTSACRFFAKVIATHGLRSIVGAPHYYAQ